MCALPAGAAESDKPPRPASVPDLEQINAAKSRAALAICRTLPEYQQLQKSFTIEDATLGLINSMPESLFVELRSTKPQPIDAAWWWNPLSRRKPSLTWQHFLTAYAAAVRVVARHPWLTQLKNLPGKRSLELHVLGTGIGKIKHDFDTHVLPAWKHAGMFGQPTYRLLARRGDHSWVEIFFSDQDDRAFVCSTSTGDPNPKSLLDRLEVHWHPRGRPGEPSSQYAVIEPSGRIRLQTYVPGQP